MGLFFGFSMNVQAGLCDDPVLIPNIGDKSEYPPEVYQKVIKKLVYSQASELQKKYCTQRIRYREDSRLNVVIRNKQLVVKCNYPVKVPLLGNLENNKNLLQKIVYRFADDFQTRWCLDGLSYQQDPKVGNWSQYVLNYTEAQSGYCSGDCNGSSNIPQLPGKDLSFINKWLQNNPRENRACQPQGYDKGMSHNEISQHYEKYNSIEGAIARYSERASGAILRGYMALLKPQYVNEARTKTNNFTDFDLLSPSELSKMLYGAKEQQGNCYQYIKAALSGDYSILTARGRRFNQTLIKNQCGLTSSIGDLAEKHWLHLGGKNYTNFAAGSSGPALKARGFINLMEPQYGVSRKYYSEEAAPVGAVLVYRCAINGRLLPEYDNGKNDCAGHIGIRTKSGVIGGDFFRPVNLNPAVKALRVLVGIYVKPEEA